MQTRDDDSLRLKVVVYGLLFLAICFAIVGMFGASSCTVQRHRHIQRVECPHASRAQTHAALRDFKANCPFKHRRRVHRTTYRCVAGVTPEECMWLHQGAEDINDMKKLVK